MLGHPDIGTKCRDLLCAHDTGSWDTSRWGARKNECTTKERCPKHHPQRTRWGRRVHLWLPHEIRHDGCSIQSIPRRNWWSLENAAARRETSRDLLQHRISGRRTRDYRVSPFLNFCVPELFIHSRHKQNHKPSLTGWRPLLSSFTTEWYSCQLDTRSELECSRWRRSKVEAPMAQGRMQEMGQDNHRISSWTKRSTKGSTSPPSRRGSREPPDHHHLLDPP